MKPTRLRLIFSTDFHAFAGLSRAATGHTLASHMQSLSIMEHQSERRSTVRYKLHLPVIFHWNDGGEFTEGGFTYDLAINGALICSTRCPPIGSNIRIEVLVPSPNNKGEQLRVQCVGKVTRAVSEGDRSSFGVRGHFDDDNIVRQIVL